MPLGQKHWERCMNVTITGLFYEGSKVKYQPVRNENFTGKYRDVKIRISHYLMKHLH